MSINVSLKKIVIVVLVLLVIGGSVQWFRSTKEIRTMIKFAQRQALEIAIIEQSVKLRNYKQKMTAKPPMSPIIIESKE